MTVTFPDIPGNAWYVITVLKKIQNYAHFKKIFNKNSKLINSPSVNNSCIVLNRDKDYKYFKKVKKQIVYKILN